MILGLGSAGFTHGWLEMWMMVYGVCPNHQHLTGETRTVLFDVYGNGLEVVTSAWLEKAGETNIPVTILLVSANSIRGTFEVTDSQAEGEWTLKIQRPGITRDLAFDILGETLDADTIAIAVWDKAVGTQAAGTAGKTLANVAGQITAAHATTDGNVNSQIAAQTTTLTNILDAIKGTGYDIAMHSLVSIRENLDTVLKRIRQQNPTLEHHITRGVIRREGNK